MHSLPSPRYHPTVASLEHHIGAPSTAQDVNSQISQITFSKRSLPFRLRGVFPAFARPAISAPPMKAPLAANLKAQPPRRPCDSAHPETFAQGTNGFFASCELLFAVRAKRFTRDRAQPDAIRHALMSRKIQLHAALLLLLLLTTQ